MTDTTPVLPDSPVELLALIEAAQHRLTTAVWAAETEDDLLAAARTLERSRCRSEAIDAQLFTEINDRCAYARDGFTRPLMWLAKGLRLGRTEAKKRYRRAETISRLTAITGETLPPKYPTTAGHLADGHISGAHVDEIRDVMTRLPWKLSPELVERAETELADLARTLTPWELRRAGITLLEYLDPDGTLADDRDRRNQRRLSLSPQNRIHMSALTADLTPSARAKLDLILASWAAPGMNNPDDTDHDRLTGAVTTIDPSDPTQADRLTAARHRDHRTPTQRNHDALEAMCDFIAGHHGLGTPNRIPGQLVITATIADLKAGCGQALTTTGTLIPVADLVDLAARLDPSLIVFADHTREILYHGRAKRSATFNHRLALFARDRGDTHPDSDTPFIHTQAHHLPDWADGGQTDIDKLTATSGPNNRAVGTKPRQWETTYQTSDPHPGRVAWRLRNHNGPPGRPRINHTHHPDDLARTIIRNIRAIGGKGSKHADPPHPPASRIENRLCNRLGYTEL
ncbi:HNH endonuclease signature motif containing protein [Gordonia crocea]|uniref:DUF222 domain-containing protein n=1 Tax=Gordonia crocea TaxID=589162 RepID=A0A7I9V248_9ACTN|nr:HNH endonuclease signature motif containing protein [Gordonia crocea]GED99099.1 hypothetical protein nbrc107697_31380 [Gordonia crocea]